jgi:hypothetical protein
VLSPALSRAFVNDPVMAAKWFSRPELNSLWHDAKTRPEWWARDFSDSESQGGFGHFGFQLEIAFHRL